jgi:hypothetical protein
MEKPLGKETKGRAAEDWDKIAAARACNRGVGPVFNMLQPMAVLAWK